MKAKRYFTHRKETYAYVCTKVLTQQRSYPNREKSCRSTFHTPEDTDYSVRQIFRSVVSACFHIHVTEINVPCGGDTYFICGNSTVSGIFLCVLLLLLWLLIRQVGDRIA